MIRNQLTVIHNKNNRSSGKREYFDLGFGKLFGGDRIKLSSQFKLSGG